MRTNEAFVKLTTMTMAGALLATGLALSGTGTAIGQVQNDQATGTSMDRAMFMRSAGRMDAETQKLASLTNQVPQRNVVPVAVDAWNFSPGEHRAMMAQVTGARRSALRGAMDKVTVAMEDRSNGASEDQHSLTEYLKHLGINPAGVIAVDVNTTRDPENPIVTVFYHRGALKGTSQGGPG